MMVIAMKRHGRRGQTGKKATFSCEEVIRRLPLRGNLETKRSSLAKGSQQEREFARLYGEIKASCSTYERRSARLSPSGKLWRFVVRIKWKSIGIRDKNTRYLNSKHMPKSTNERIRIAVREINKRDRWKRIYVIRREYNIIFNIHKIPEKKLIAYVIIQMISISE